MDSAPAARPVTRLVKDGPQSGHIYRTNAEVERDLDDPVLVRLVRSGGDQRAAGTLFDRYAPLVRRILLRTLGPFCEIEDQVQETFITFFRSLKKLKNDDSARAFLISIAVRIARHQLRHKRVRRILRLAADDELSDFAGASHGADLEAREALRRVYAILDDLDTSSRLVFTLRFFEEMELMEVALATGESLASVKRRLARVVPIVNARASRDDALAPYVKEDARDDV